MTIETKAVEPENSAPNARPTADQCFVFRPRNSEPTVNRFDACQISIAVK